MMRNLTLLFFIVMGTNVAGAEEKLLTALQLTGLSQVSLDIFPLDADARDCGISRELLRDAFMFPVSSTRLKIADTAHASFQILTTTVKVSSGCFSALNTRVNSIEYVDLIATGKRTITNAVLWRREGTAIYAPQDRHPQQMRDYVENITKKFLTDWNVANQK